jgi:hypothetical protein
MSAAIRLAIGLTLAFAVHAGVSGADPVPASRQAVRIDFRRLHPGGDLRLAGRSVQRTLTFELNRRWRPADGSALHLVVRPSPHLDSDRSFLSIAVNYGLLRSLRLGPSNGSEVRIVVPIPPALLKRRNEIQFVVEQHASADTTSADVWTTISGESFVEVQGIRRSPPMDLAELPDSFTDGVDGIHDVAVLMPGRLSAGTLEGTALLVANLAKEVLPGRLRLHVTQSPRTSAPLLVVGTPEEQPYLARLAVRLRSTFGVVGLGTGPQGQRVLFATGTTAEAVKQAAVAALRRKTLAGESATIVGEEADAPAAIRQWNGYVPPRATFRLADLEDTDLAIGAQRGLPLSVPIKVTPDVRFLGYGHRVSLRISVNPAVFDPTARLAVSWNHSPLGMYRLADYIDGETAAIDVWPPAALLKPDNALTLQWIDGDTDDRAEAAAWLLRDTEFYLPRYYEANLPDLGLLSAGFYPFSLRADLRDVVVVMPPRLTATLFGALLDLSAAVARMMPGEHAAFRVKGANELSPQDLFSSHAIVLHSDETPSPLAVRLARSRRMLWSESGGRNPVIQEVESPWSSGRYLLALTAATDRELRGLISSTFSEQALANLSGDAAVVTQDGLAGRVISPARSVGDYSYAAAAEAWLRTNWAALPAILTLASGLFFVACRLALRARRPLRG